MPNFRNIAKTLFIALATTTSGAPLVTREPETENAHIDLPPPSCKEGSYFRFLYGNEDDDVYCASAYPPYNSSAIEQVMQMNPLPCNMQKIPTPQDPISNWTGVAAIVDPHCKQRKYGGIYGSTTLNQTAANCMANAISPKVELTPICIADRLGWGFIYALASFFIGGGVLTGGAAVLVGTACLGYKVYEKCTSKSEDGPNVSLIDPDDDLPEGLDIELSPRPSPCLSMNTP